MKKWILMGMLLCVAIVTTARNCPRCHGKGRIQTRHPVSTYGIDISRMECPYCGQMIMKGESHWDDCPACGGTGQGSSSSDGGSYDNYDALLQFMTPEEILLMEELMKQAYTQVPQYTPCPTCNETGDCKQCGGYVNLSIDEPLCPLCGGSGRCLTCRGSGYSHVEYVDNPKRDEIVQRIQELLNDAKARSQQGNSGYSSDMSSDTESSFYDDGDIYKKLSAKKSIGKGIGVFVIILIIAVVCFFLYKKHKKN